MQCCQARLEREEQAHQARKHVSCEGVLQQLRPLRHLLCCTRQGRVRFSGRRCAPATKVCCHCYQTFLSSFWTRVFHRQLLARENGVVLAHSPELCHIDHLTQWRSSVVHSTARTIVYNSVHCAGCLLLRCLAGSVMHHIPFGVHSCSLPLLHIASAASLLHCVPGVCPSSLHKFSQSTDR